MEKDNSRKFRLLCLEHIKVFNKKWNYFENMSSEEVEYFVKSDLTCINQRKALAHLRTFNILWNNALEDKLNIFNTSNYANYKKANLSQKDKDALEVMELKSSSNWEEIQKNLNCL